MRLIQEASDWPSDVRSGGVAIGNFDGVHLGHARIVEALLRQARRVGGPAVIFTFDPHPVRLLRPAEAPPPLTWTNRKAELLSELGVDAVIAFPTDEQTLSLTAEEFFQKFIVQALDARAIVEGSNFHFGKDRGGDVNVLRKLAAASGRDCEIVEPVIVDGLPVSSSRVRECIAQGDVERACRLLTRPYRLRGMVTHGAGRGNKLGYPTANVDAIDTILPAHGVYAGIVHSGKSVHPGAINIGPNPTFGDQKEKVEAHLIGYHGSLYGTAIEVDFLRKLRETRPFSGVEELKKQLAADVALAGEIAGKYLIQNQGCR